MANILIFDSGVGGLSVYQAVSQQVANQQYFYLFDNACFPYGELSEACLVERVLALFNAFVKQYHIDLAIIACNTASTYVLPALRSQLAIPIVGVVPAIKPAAEHSRAQLLLPPSPSLSQHIPQAVPQKAGHIGVLATPGTVSRRYTAELINNFAADLRVSLLGTTELVEMAEDKLAGLAIDNTRLATILAPWQAEDGPDTLVLGCTHFPLLATEISHYLPKVKLIDSGAAIARRVVSLLNNVDATLCAHPTKQVFCTALTKKARLQAKAFVHIGFSELQCFNVIPASSH